MSTLVGLPSCVWCAIRWCHCCCAGIHSAANYRRLATWSCPTCFNPVPLAAPTWEAESSDMERTQTTLSSGGSPVQRSLSIRPSSPAQTSITAPGPTSEGGRFLQLNCNGIQHCRAELQDFLHRHQVFVPRLQETKLGVNSNPKVFTGYANIRRDRLTGGSGGGLVTPVHHSVPYRVLDDDILPDDDTVYNLAVETDLGETTLTFVNVYIHHPPPLLPELRGGHNLVRWLAAYLRCRKASCIYQQHHLLSRQVRLGVPQVSVISPAIFKHFVSDCPISDLDMTSYPDDFTLLTSAPSIVEAEARANQLCCSLVRWADGKHLAIAPQKSNVTLFTSDNH